MGVDDCCLLQLLGIHGGIHGRRDRFRVRQGSGAWQKGHFMWIWGTKTTFPAVPGWSEEKGACCSSKEQRPRSGLLGFQRGCISKM